MADRTARETIEAYVDAINRADWTLLRELLADDYVEDYLQSGERIRGRENAVAVRSQFPRPSMDEPPSPSVGAKLYVGGEERWALAPNFTAVRMTSDGETITSVVRARYPDGPWYVVYIGTVEHGQIRRATVVFGAVFEAPEWRRQWVEHMPDRDR